MEKIDKKRVFGICTVLATIGFSILLISTPTDALINYIGTDNVYIFMYTIAFVGSISTFASIPYPLILIGLVAGGMNPFLMGLVSALGVVTADSLTFFVARSGRILLSERFKSSLSALSHRLKKHPHLLTPGLIIYGTLSPLSNDFAVISLSGMEYAYHRVIPPLAFGNILYNIGVAYLGLYAYNWITAIV